MKGMSDYIGMRLALTGLCQARSVQSEPALAHLDQSRCSGSPTQRHTPSPAQAQLHTRLLRGLTQYTQHNTRSPDTRGVSLSLKHNTHNTTTMNGGHCAVHRGGVGARGGVMGRVRVGGGGLDGPEAVLRQDNALRGFRSRGRAHVSGGIQRSKRWVPGMCRGPRRKACAAGAVLPSERLSSPARTCA
jgi:hypothetical protein